MIEVFQQHQSCRIAGKFSYQTNDIFLKNNEQNAVVCKNTLKRQSVIRFGLLGVNEHVKHHRQTITDASSLLSTYRMRELADPLPKDALLGFRTDIKRIIDRQPKVIQAGNDKLRRYHHGGNVVITPTVQHLEPAVQYKLFDTAATFDNFSEDNDPCSEHDCASFEEEEGETYMFKVDYYNKDMTAGSEDPADPRQTILVMTLLHQFEY